MQTDGFLSWDPWRSWEPFSVLNKPTFHSFAHVFIHNQHRTMHLRAADSSWGEWVLTAPPPTGWASLSWERIHCSQKSIPNSLSNSVHFSHLALFKIQIKFQNVGLYLFCVLVFASVSVRSQRQAPNPTELEWQQLWVTWPGSSAHTLTCWASGQLSLCFYRSNHTHLLCTARGCLCSVRSTKLKTLSGLSKKGLPVRLHF